MYELRFVNFLLANIFIFETFFVHNIIVHYYQFKAVGHLGGKVHRRSDNPPAIGLRLGWTPDTTNASHTIGLTISTLTGR